MRFVFGVPALDLPGQYDLELSYDEAQGIYLLDLETIYYFKSIGDEHRHYIRLLREFTDYMKQSGFDCEYEPSMNDICYWGSRVFNSIEMAYAWFRFIVEAHTALY